MVDVLGCGPGSCGFESHLSPFFRKTARMEVTIFALGNKQYSWFIDAVGVHIVSMDRFDSKKECIDNIRQILAIRAIDVIDTTEEKPIIKIISKN